jgi:hypothetical protein
MLNRTLTKYCDLSGQVCWVSHLEILDGVLPKRPYLRFRKECPVKHLTLRNQLPSIGAEDITLLIWAIWEHPAVNWTKKLFFEARSSKYTSLEILIQPGACLHA